MYFKQCQLQKDKSVQVAWIPEHLAKLGKHLKINVGVEVFVFDGEPTREVQWDEGWVVTEVGARRSETEVREHERDHKKHRNNTDVVRARDGRWERVR